jgi:hypothetical protein
MNTPRMGVLKALRNTFAKLGKVEVVQQLFFAALLRLAAYNIWSQNSYIFCRKCCFRSSRANADITLKDFHLMSDDGQQFAICFLLLHLQSSQNGVATTGQ